MGHGEAINPKSEVIIPAFLQFSRRKEEAIVGSIWRAEK
jgi:hypothetical protein